MFRSRKEAVTHAKEALRNLARGNASLATLRELDAQAFQVASAKLDKLNAELNEASGSAGKPQFAFTLEDAISDFCAARRVLPSGSLVDAAKAFSVSVATIKRVELGAAVAEFNAERKAKSKSVDGKRAALSQCIALQGAKRLLRFSEAAGTVTVCDLRMEAIDNFFASYTAGFSPKTRNHYRSTLHMFIKWCVRKWYLSESHGLARSNWLFPDGKAGEATEVGEVKVYSASELSSLLSAARGNQVALLAIAALAGLRTEELFRLDWSDVWRRKGFIEVTAQKAKTRSRRLVPIVPALAAWLSPFREHDEGKLWQGKEVRYHKRLRALFKRTKITRRLNAFRHSFISYRLALVRNEHQVAAEAGTSTQMIHQHYRELVTPDEAEAFFNVQPPVADGLVRLAS